MDWNDVCELSRRVKRIEDGLANTRDDISVSWNLFRYPGVELGISGWRTIRILSLPQSIEWTNLAFGVMSVIPTAVLISPLRSKSFAKVGDQVLGSRILDLGKEF
jgi:hypothetical protein